MKEEDAPGSKQAYNLFKLDASELMGVSVKANNATLEMEVDSVCHQQEDVRALVEAHNKASSKT